MSQKFKVEDYELGLITIALIVFLVLFADYYSRIKTTIINRVSSLIH